jgi:trimethylamine-N-oxide reductase cytochrome c-type subunit TorC
MFRRLGRWLRSLNIMVAVGLALLTGLTGGLAVWGSFNVVATATSTSAVAAGASALTTATTTLFLDPGQADGGGAGDGSLLAGSQVEVVALSGTLAQVKVSGWQQQGVERAIYALEGQRIVDAVLKPPAIAKLQQITTRTDPNTGIVWHQVALVGWLAKASLTDDAAGLWSEASTLYASHCGTCHALHPPDSHLANEWSGVASSMMQRSGLNDEQFRLVVKYLQMHAKDTGGPNG